MDENHDDFDQWVSCVAETYVHLTSDQQKSTITKLLSDIGLKGFGDEGGIVKMPNYPENSCRILQSIWDIMHVDFLSSLPVEVNEVICSYLDEASLLKACSVSLNWNRIISSLHKVWEMRCKLNGFKNIAAGSWKMKFFKGEKILNDLQPSRGLVLHHIPVRVFAALAISCLNICGGFLYASAGRMVSIWRITAPLEQTPVVDFMVETNVSAICGCEPKNVICGHTSGHVSNWVWGYDMTVDKSSCVVGHEGVVSCVTVNERLGLVASAGHDCVTKVWCLSSLCLLLEIPRTEEISQVTMSSYDEGLSEFQEFMVVTSANSFTAVDHCLIKPSKLKKMCKYCEVKEIAWKCNDVTSTTCDWKIVVDYRTPCHLVQGKLVYMRMSGNNSEIVVGSRDGEISDVLLNGKYHVLAVGKMYALLLSEDRSINYNFLLFNLKKKCVSASWKFEMPVTNQFRDLFRIAIGDISWLDDLGHLRTGQPILSWVNHRSQINVVFWEPVTEHETKEAATVIQL